MHFKVHFCTSFCIQIHGFWFVFGIYKTVEYKQITFLSIFLMTKCFFVFFAGCMTCIIKKHWRDSFQLIFEMIDGSYVKDHCWNTKSYYFSAYDGGVKRLIWKSIKSIILTLTFASDLFWFNNNNNRCPFALIFAVMPGTRLLKPVLAVPHT